MKIITLNVWAGRVSQKLVNFFDQNNTIDVFCLQEVYHNGIEDNDTKLKDYEIFSKIKKVLPCHRSYFRPHLLGHYGLAIFSKKEIEVLEEGDVFVHKYKGYIPEENLGFHARNIQYIKIKHNNKNLTILNFHGLWNNQGKTDTEDRIQQSKNILDFIQKIDGEIILCGDFNLLPETESIKIFESNGLVNLIKKYEINSTRTSLYEKPDKFADYVFVTKGVNAKDLKVLPDEVSDHSALLLEIE